MIRLLLFICIIGINCSAEIIATVTSGANFTFDADAVDLANSDQESFASIEIDDVAKRLFGSNESLLVDGDVYNGLEVNNTSATLTPEGTNPNEAVVTINFDLDFSADGYDIDSIVVLSGTGQGRARHNYDIEFSTVGDDSFNALFSVVNEGDTNGEVQSIIADDSGALIASNVDAIRFIFSDTNVGNRESMYREIDVIGTANAVPEPSTYIMIFLFLVIGMRLKKR